MHLEDKDLSLLKSAVRRQLSLLNRKIEHLIELEGILSSSRRDFHSQVNRYTFLKPEIEALIPFATLTDRYRLAENDRVHALRELDSIAGAFSSYISFAIDYCMENYDMEFKQWIRKSLASFARATEKICEETQVLDFYFPTASAQLAAYIYKTRTVEHPEHFAGIRNAIRQILIRP